MPAAPSPDPNSVAAAGLVLAEVCIESAADARAAAAAGADRVELCGELSVGGVTPPLEALRQARATAGLPVAAMLRPRGGDFVYGKAEIVEMERSAPALRQAGAEAVVFGALRPDGRLDLPALERLVAASQGMELVFHRAFDELVDRAEALEELIRLGFRRVLSSGGEPEVVAGIPELRRLVGLAGDRIQIMPGGGVRAGNLARVVAETGACQIHFSGKRAYGEPTRVEDLRPFLDAMGR